MAQKNNRIPVALSDDSTSRLISTHYDAAYSAVVLAEGRTSGEDFSDLAISTIWKAIQYKQKAEKLGKVVHLTPGLFSTIAKRDRIDRFRSCRCRRLGPVGDRRWVRMPADISLDKIWEASPGLMEVFCYTYSVKNKYAI